MEDELFALDFEPAPVVDLVPLSEHDLIKRDLAKLEAEISLLTGKRDKFTTVVNECEEKKIEARRIYEAKMLKLEEDRREAVLKAGELNRSIQDLKYRMNALNSDLAKLANLKALAARMQYAEQMILDFFETSKWWKLGAQFQKDDITFGVRAYLDGLHGLANFNEMGTGKTMETAALNQILTAMFNQDEGRQPKRLWLTKRSLVKSNIKEILEWTPEEQPIYCQGSPMQREFATQLALETGNLLVTNYEAVRTTPLIQNTEWDFVYIDEVHKLKGGANPSGPTDIWKAIKEICIKAKFPIMLSGSPIMNHPREMWSYLHIFNPERFPNVRSFERDFCFGYGVDGVTVDFTRLITVMKDQSFRRTKKEVSAQLKALDIEKLYSVRNVELSGEQLAIYNEMRTKFFVWLDAERTNALTASAIIAQLTRLRQIALLPSAAKFTDASTGIEHRITCTESAKLDETVELIEELTEAGEQVLVFCAQFNEPIYELQRRLDAIKITHRAITGENSNKTQELEAGFQNADYQVLIINMRTGSEGLNLQKNPDRWSGGASNVIFLDKWWNPETNKQAEDRLVRFGQTDVVTVHTIHADNTVDELLEAINIQKAGMIAGIMESNELRTATDWKNYLEGMI